MSAEQEISLAKLTRRKGILYMVFLFWGIVTNDGRFTLGCLQILAAYNYPGINTWGYGAGWIYPETNLDVASAWMGIAWLVTVVLGTARYIGWLAWLLNRWPPLSNT